MPLSTFINKTVFITGSSIGIGAVTAIAFAREGANIIITYLNDKEAAEEAAKKCKEHGAKRVLVLKLDVTDGDSIKRAVEEIVNTFNEISILINNAGVLAWNPLVDQSMEEIEQQVRVNLLGTINVTKACLPYLQNTIINVGSGAGMQGYSDLTVYCATKFGIRGFSKALAKELPTILVLTVNPGMTATKMTDYRGIDPEIVADVILNAAKGVYGNISGADINVWEHGVIS